MVDEAVSDLTRAIASGDTEAFARFYDRWFDAMYAEARRVTRRDEAFCLDVVQDAMLRVIRGMKPLDTESRLHCWVRRVVHSCALDRLRADLRRARRDAAHRTSQAPQREELQDRLDWLRKQLNGLDEPSFDLLLMRHRFGWTLARIGRILGLTPGAVDGRLNRITERLRREAEERFDET